MAMNWINEMFDELLLVAIIITGTIVMFNGFQINEISAKINDPSFLSNKASFSGNADIADLDISQVSTTAMAIATVFPELQGASNENEIMSIMLPTGTPEYSAALGGISFDDPVNSLAYLAQWWYSFKEEVKQTDPASWQRYVSLAAAPHGISCEYCCGLGAQGADANGESMCGCQHNPALLAITLGLVKYTDYTDAQILREALRWKTIFFPQNMIALAFSVVGQDPSQLASLPGMVGGC